MFLHSNNGQGNMVELINIDIIFNQQLLKTHISIITFYDISVRSKFYLM